MNGNSNILCDEFMKGAIEAGNEVKKINVSRKNVAGCLGCLACQTNGGICVQKDNMDEIREKMLAADVIVLASPIYYYSIASQLKAVIDRTFAFFRDLKGKTFYYIFACAAPEESYTETMIKALDGFTCCVPDAKVAGTVMGLGTMVAGDVKKTVAVKQAYEMGKSVK